MRGPQMKKREKKRTNEREEEEEEEEKEIEARGTTFQPGSGREASSLGKPTLSYYISPTMAPTIKSRRSKHNRFRRFI